MKRIFNASPFLTRAIGSVTPYLKTQHHHDHSIINTKITLLRNLSQVYYTAASSTPFHIILRTILFSISQVSLLLTIILPWKLIVLISTEHLPYGMPTALQSLDKDTQIELTIYAIIASLVMYLLCDVASEYVNKKGAMSILSKNGKTGLFNNYQELALKSYSCISDSIASFIFCMLVIIWIIVAYPLLLLSVTTFPLLFFTLHFLSSKAVKESTLSSGQNIWHKIWIHIGFIYTLIWVVVDYFSSPPQIIIAFISLLSIRQFLIVSLNMGLKINFTTRNIDRISSLFIITSVWSPKPNTQTLQNLTETSNRNEVIKKILARECLEFSELKTSCRIASQGHTAYLEADIKTSEDKATSSARMIKIYSNSKTATAEHELAILKESQPHWPSPRVTGHGVVDNMFYIATSWEHNRSWLDMSERNKHLQEMISKIISCDISKELASSYERTHPSLESKLRNINWDVLIELASSSSNRENLLLSQSLWDTFTERLSELPRQVVIPDITRRLTSKNLAQEIYLCNWSQWRWEPIGSSWPFKHTLSEPIHHALSYASTYRKEIKSVSIDDIKTTSLASKLAFSIDRHDYHTAEKIILDILGILEKKTLID